MEINGRSEKLISRETQSYKQQTTFQDLIFTRKDMSKTQNQVQIMVEHIDHDERMKVWSVMGEIYTGKVSKNKPEHNGCTNECITVVLWRRIGKTT